MKFRTAQEIQETHWDYIIIGTGIGGSTVGHQLAAAGKKVLFCEKGISQLHTKNGLKGKYPEEFARSAQDVNAFSRAGRYSETIFNKGKFFNVKFVPFIGSGTGGSSALYGMAFERFFPTDFEPKLNHPAAEGSSVPNSWPIKFKDFLPFYDKAEKLYAVRGERDPLKNSDNLSLLKKAPQFSHAYEVLAEHLKAQNLHPYRLPLACEFVEGCDCCQGFLCPKNCKNDAVKICLEPAITKYAAELLDECEVLRLDADTKSVTSVECRWKNQELRLRSKKIILAAGALESPALLLRSASEIWPNGLANSSDQVGRNLMRHHLDLYALSSAKLHSSDIRQKEIAFNDFYNSGNIRGSVQSFGQLPPAIVHYELMIEQLSRGPFFWLSSLAKLFKPVILSVVDFVLKSDLVMASTMEDLPYSDNRITLTPLEAKIRIEYSVRNYEKSRTEQFRKLLLAQFKPFKTRLIKQAENNFRLAHAAGTCRFGSDPRSFVLDPNNKTWDLANLYVVDSSFFPSSGAANPSLTIAANALRVAEHLLNDIN